MSEQLQWKWIRVFEKLTCFYRLFQSGTRAFQPDFTSGGACDGSFLLSALQISFDCRFKLPNCNNAANRRGLNGGLDAVYRAVQLVPAGSCTTYGHIARLLGYPQRARQVGICLKHIPDYDSTDPDKHFFHSDNVPWQRVVNAKGGISSRGDGGVAVARHVQRLRAEGVEVSDARGIEEHTVDLSTCGWFPKHLPGEESGH